MSSILTVPGPIRTLFSYFPLYTHPPLSHRVPAISSPVLWIRPPRGHETDLLSGDVECLKWQAYLALRGFTNVFVRWDISPDGAIDGRLPNLHVPGKVAGGELLAAHSIASWVDSQVGGDALEGYRDQLAKDESHAWVSLLEGNVHAALIVNQAETPPLWSLWSLSSATTSRPIESLISPPPAPLSGFSSLIAPHGTHFSVSAVEMQYCEAISALSQRLRTDEWFLDSEGPTALDALVFAYLHTIMHAKDEIRIEVAKHANLVVWELKVRHQATFDRTYRARLKRTCATFPSRGPNNTQR